METIFYLVNSIKQSDDKKRKNDDEIGDVKR